MSFRFKLDWGRIQRYTFNYLLPTPTPNLYTWRTKESRGDHQINTLLASNDHDALLESESHSVMSDSLRPRGYTYSPWNSPGQKPGCASVRLVTQSCPTLCDPVDCSSPGFSVHGILQARTLEWVAMPSSWDLPNPGLPHWRWILYQLSHQENPALLAQDISPIANLLIKSSLHKAGSQALTTRQPVVFPKQSFPLIFQGKATPGLIFTTDGQRLRLPEIKMISHLRPAMEDSLVP